MTSGPENALAILYQDERYIAINKPPGLLVHRTSIDARERQFALQQLRDQIDQHVYPTHRLDKPTSGVLLFALDDDALVAARKMFEADMIEKTYLAIVRGHPPANGTIDHPLRKLLDRGPKAKSETAQEARTDFRTLATTELPIPTGRYPATRYAQVELKPQTGRRHQLRRHLAHINCPIIGDTRHGDTRCNHAFAARYGFIRLFLHASRLSFRHPFSKATVGIEAPLWPDFGRALEATGLTGV